MQMIQARWFTPVASGGRPIIIIVIHSMESPNKPDTAEAIGRFFQGLPTSGKASAHIGGDQNSLVRYVHDKDVAYAAPGANRIGLHLELSGYARYRNGEWSQPEMMSMLSLAARQVREWSKAYNIPLRYVDAGQLRAGASGVTTHNECTKAFGGTHWDPGPGFPIQSFVAMANTGRTTLEEVEDQMPAYLHCENPTGGYWLVKPLDGGIFAYDGAPFFGALPGPNFTLASPIVDMAACVRDGQTVGYWLLGADGGVFAFGAAPFTDSYAGHPEWHAGRRFFVGIQQKGDGYVLLSVEEGTDPPHINPYDLSVR